MFIRIIVLLSFLIAPIYAQNGDKKDAGGEKQIAPIPPEKIPPAPVLTPEQALKSFKVAKGFRVEVVASEPLVQDPVAITFGPDGRIWVVEMSGYMPNADGIGEDQPVGKIAVLEDVDGDGKMDKRTVFAEKLVMPRALALVRDGLLVAEPPHLWFMRDTDGDGKEDDKTEVAKDYGDQKSPEHTANGLMWALDNWIYSADTTMRFRSLEEGWKREPTAFRGQWGISQDDFGRLVYNSNSDQYRMDLVPSQYLNRNPNFRTPLGLNVDPIKNQATWPVRITPGVNRGYRPGTLRRDGTLASFTAACAPLIYRGDNFPNEFYGNAFVCEPSANLIKRNILVETNGGIRGFHAYTNAEFFASTDERFRPVNLNNAPDGTLYVVDMYHGILQHRIFLTSYLRAQSEARGLEKPLGMGRIYRVIAEGAKPRKVLLAKKTSAELVKNLSDANGWVRDTAQRLLVERAESAVVPELRKLAVAGESPLARLHALWTLEGMSALDQPTLLKAFSDEHSKNKAAAIRLSEPLLKTDARSQILTSLLKLVNDRSSDVQLQLAFSLGEIVDPKAEMGMAVIAKNTSSNLYLRDALLTGLYKRELEFLEKILSDKTWEQKSPGNDSFLSGLAQCIFVEGKTNRVNRLFELATAANSWQRAGLLNGILAIAPKGKNAVIKPVRFNKEPDGFAALKKLDEKETKATVEKITALVTWPGKAGYVAPPIIKTLTAEQQKRFEAGRELYATTCAACHQLTGLGMEGLAPPLADSEWVLGSEQRIARIVLHGVRGPISVKGKTYEMDMPSLAIFDDEQIASVLTYIRREWDHGANPIDPETVKKARDASSDRVEAWSEAELLKIP